MTAAAAGPRYLPYLAGRFRLAMGLMALDEADWIDPDDRFAAELGEKQRLLEDDAADVVRTRPGSEAAQQEAVDRLIAHMVAHHPDILACDGDDVLVRPVGRSYRLDDWTAAPIDLAGRLVQEDFCLMAPGDAGYTLEAASMCFPARWRLVDKMGKAMTAIHGPVPDFGARLARPVDRFFDHLRVDHPVWRVNWSLNDDPTLYQPVRRQQSRADATISSANAGERLYLRCERQALHRLPATGWILFTIRTHVDPVSSLETRPDAAAGLAAALRDMPAAMQRYKNVAPFRDALLAYLDRIAAR